MKTIHKHDILRAWPEREIIDLQIQIYEYDESTGQMLSGAGKLNLSSKSIYVKIYDESGNLVLSKAYTGTNNPHIAVQEDDTISSVIIHFLPNDYLSGFKASPNEYQWFSLEMHYYSGTSEPPLTKHVFPYISKEGSEMHFWIKLLRSRSSA